MGQKVGHFGKERVIKLEIYRSGRDQKVGDLENKRGR